METIIIKVPIRLISEANLGGHWRIKQRRRKKLITDFAFLFRAFRLSDYLKLSDSKTLHIKLIRIAPRQLDSDNVAYAFKPIRDYLGDYLIPGLKPGQADSDKFISWSYDQEKGKPKEYAILIEIS